MSPPPPKAGLVLLVAISPGCRAVPACHRHLVLVEQMSDSPATPHLEPFTTATHGTAAVLMGPTTLCPSPLD